MQNNEIVILYNYNNEHLTQVVNQKRVFENMTPDKISKPRPM